MLGGVFANRLLAQNRRRMLSLASREIRDEPEGPVASDEICSAINHRKSSDQSGCGRDVRALLRVEGPKGL